MCTTAQVFHVNQAHFHVAPSDMNSADLQGDMMFSLRGVALPLECAQHPQGSVNFDCNNPESSARGPGVELHIAIATFTAVLCR